MCSAPPAKVCNLKPKQQSQHVSTHPTASPAQQAIRVQLGNLHHSMLDQPQQRTHTPEDHANRITPWSTIAICFPACPAVSHSSMQSCMTSPQHTKQSLVKALYIPATFTPANRRNRGNIAPQPPSHPSMPSQQAFMHAHTSAPSNLQ